MGVFLCVCLFLGNLFFIFIFRENENLEFRVGYWGATGLLVACVRF